MLVVGRAVRQALERAGMSQASLGSMLGVSANTVFNWANGKVDKVDAFALAEIFRLAGMSLDREFGLVDPEQIDAAEVYARIAALDRKVDTIMQSNELIQLAKRQGEFTDSLAKAEDVGKRALDEIEPAVSSEQQQRRRKAG